jgi:glycoprotein-N-acetylgalactosamine 3-beta-galactosyltransferase
MDKYFKVYILITIICLAFLIFNLRCKNDLYSSYIIPKSSENNEAKVKHDIESITDSSVLCIIMTSEKTFMERSVTVWNSWAKKCHKALFACNCANLTTKLKAYKKSMLPTLVDYKSALDVPIWQLDLAENYDLMAEKVFAILEAAYKDYGNLYKWFLLTDDDTFTFVDNMHRFTSKKSFKEPVTYGYNFKVIVPTGYHSGGGGVLFTHEAFKRIHANIKNGVCAEKSGYGDVALGFCAYKSNVTMGDSLDKLGRERFHSLDYIAHYKGHIPDWLRDYSSNGVKTGVECCSDETITFHYTSVEQMKFFGSLKDQRLFQEIYKTFN